MIRLFRFSIGNVFGGGAGLRVWVVYLRWPVKIDFWQSDPRQHP
jgi:hypothetical protein